MAQQLHASSTQRTWEAARVSAKACAPVVLRYEKYQDVIHVNSIENEDNQQAPPTTGVKHYLLVHYQRGLISKPSLDHIDYAALSRSQSSTPTFSFDMDPPPMHLHPRAPSPPSPPSTYASPVYAGHTHNPAVFLAILTLAHGNLPSLNLVSALNHIPNMAPSDTLTLPASSFSSSELHTSVTQPFLETCSPRPKRDDDEDINVVFLPYFYDNGTRHAMGFFQIGRCPLRGRVLGTAFFTPCTEGELRRFGLVTYMDEEGEGGVEKMRRIGCEKGAWRERDTVEEWEEWKLVYRVASVAWETRMGLMRGEIEE
ncbi:hypothetical protein SVAN01_10503 [Stagonosporopsis vannaccii]|nr:hypothetical protein SVAN01_10503 [Stagonosporopsis vannaccii]